MADKPKDTALAIRGENYSTGDEFAKTLLDLRARGMIVLTPVTFVQQPPQMYSYGLTVVQISLDVRAKEAYHDPRWKDGELAITHKGLARLWNAAGGEWEWTARADDGKNAYIAEMVAKGRIKDLQGEWHSATKRAREDYRDGQPQVIGWSEKQLLEARRKITERCESKAQNRVIRELLNVRDSYHRDELASPFVLAKLVFQPDLSDPAIRKAYVEHGLHGTAALFGPSPVVDGGNYGVRGVIQIPSSPEDLNDADQEPPPEVEPDTEGALDEELEMKGVDFQAADPKAQIALLQALVIKKKYDKARLEAPIDKMEPRHRLGFYKHLLSMPDAA